MRLDKTPLQLASEMTPLQRAIRSHRAFREQYPAIAGFMSNTSSASMLADAYIAMLDEQEALAVPYDFEWLAARPEFERDGLSLSTDTRNGLRIVVWQGFPPRWYLRNVTVLELGRTSWVDTPVPGPATKADAIKLLEVFT